MAPPFHWVPSRLFPDPSGRCGGCCQAERRGSAVAWSGVQLRTAALARCASTWVAVRAPPAGAPLLQVARAGCCRMLSTTGGSLCTPPMTHRAGSPREGGRSPQQRAWPASRGAQGPFFAWQGRAQGGERLWGGRGVPRAHGFRVFLKGDWRNHLCGTGTNHHITWYGSWPQQRSLGHVSDISPGGSVAGTRGQPDVKQQG